MSRIEPVVLAPEWGAPAGVRVIQTTRHAGASPPPWDSLDLGLHTGDDPALVHRNRAALRGSLPSDPLWLRQVHGVRIVDADADAAPAHGEPDGKGTANTADGATTTVPERVVAVLTADCLPVVVTNASATRVTVVHAGWRGLAAGIVREALAGFAPDESLHVWLGAAIGPEAFEVGAEVREAFVHLDDRHAAAFAPAGVPGKFMADLYALARGEVRTAAGERASVSGGGRCTVAERDVFFSHRRDGARSGRMATLAWLERVGTIGESRFTSAA